MLLQVHDELVFEAPPEEIDQVKALMKLEMEDVYKLDIPLLADWRDDKYLNINIITTILHNILCVDKVQKLC